MAGFVLIPQMYASPSWVIWYFTIIMQNVTGDHINQRDILFLLSGI